LSFEFDEFAAPRVSPPGPRPVALPSRPAQIALLLAGTVALTLLVLQVLADGRHGLISGQGMPFDSAATAIASPAAAPASGQR
jgi:hypothetical protein